MIESNIKPPKLSASDHPELSDCSKIVLKPIISVLSRKILRLPFINPEDIADKEWQLSPGIITVTRPAYFLPNQLERVTGMYYTTNPRRDMAGGIEIYQKPTMGFLLKDAWLVNRAIFKDNFVKIIHKLDSYIPQIRVEKEVDRGAVYSSVAGNGWFGLWLTDDCSLYPLAESEGIPITTDQKVSSHILAYEEWLGMRPVRLHSAFLREVVIFDDQYTQNLNKKARFRTISDKLLSRVDAKPHPGVFILRRNSGKRRILNNELELAEYLRERRGFRILDITTADVPTIVATCAGAQVLVGVEGSHMVHGVMVLQPGGSVLALQPPDRFCSVLKWTLDRDDQNFGFVVGHAEGGGFRIDPTEVERTLDLFPASS